ncbi:MAG: hypothetical protein ABSG81_16175 [Acidimicrobiales bacterium]
MEDRTTAGLYLELGNLAPGDYAARRAPALLARPGVQRVSWWRTNVPGRDELPMTVPDGTLLGVAEVDDGFCAPDPLPATTAHHFARHPRPSQGVLTGEPTTGLLVVWISPRTPELAASLRDWGDFVHIRHIARAAVPGFTQIAAYENRAATEPRYMHFYELDTDDPEEAYMEMARHMARYFGGSRTDAFRIWADFEAPGGAVQYCNTFTLIGSARREAA